MLVLKQNRTLDQAMEQMPELSPADRALAYRLAKTVLRYKLAFDKLLKPYLKQPLKESRFDITVCLYIGAAQLLVLETPPHAAVNTTVNLAKSCFPKLSGLVNAVCKRMIADEAKIQLEPLETLPGWLRESWIAAYGRASAKAMVKAGLQEPPLDVTWSVPLEIGQIMPGGSIRLPQGVRFADLEGTGWAQDVAASLPVKLLGDVKGLKILDACAAPGGKTMQLASAGAEVTAVDISQNRLKRLEENLERNDLQAEIICADLKKWQPEARYDVIVLDAPCSATGTLRRHPEILHHRTPQDVARLVEIQRTLIEQCLGWLKPDGKLLYITCSLQPEEGEGQMQNYQNRMIPFQTETLTLPPKWLTKQGFLRTIPAYLSDEGGMDGFFAALISA